MPLVKFTGGQRIDLLGVKKDDLPKMWKDLGIPSGHAYTKAFRTCKSCVGTDFCRYGVGDSIALAQKIERRFQGIESPHKMKLATAGCPRNCSEAYVKDLGAVAIEGGQWEIYIGGAAGGSVRKGDLLCTVKTHDEVLKFMGRFMQYYREHGKYLERSYGFVERLGIETSARDSRRRQRRHLRASRRGDPEGRGCLRRSVEGSGAARLPRTVQRARAGPGAGSRGKQRLIPMSTTTINLGSIEKIALGQGRCFIVGGEEIAVFRQRDGHLFATQNRCPHSRARSPKA